TSYIYSLFANQVDKFCEGSSIPLCSRQLLKYGLGTLKNIEEEDLDAMDPYQRGANNIDDLLVDFVAVWETLMQGHRFQKTTPKPQKKGSKSKPNSFEDESFSDYEDYEAGNEDSGRLDNVYILPPPKGFVSKVDDEKTNDEAEVVEKSGTNIIDILKTPDGKGVFNRFQNQYRPVAVSTEKVASSTKKPILNRESYFIDFPLTGPMVVKVYPDGRPVRESTQTPQDDDLRQYQLQKVKIPTF
ncbi:hypothetical protein D910_02827, partial [Dendroctonus ponderosae]